MVKLPSQDGKYERTGGGGGIDKKDKKKQTNSAIVSVDEYIPVSKDL